MRFALPHRRRGLASLELVLSLPFLLAMAAIIVSLAKVGLAKSHSSIEARADAWRKRPAAAGSETPSPSPVDDIVRFGSSGKRGIASGQGSNAVRLAPVLQQSTVTAATQYQVLAGTWDHEVLKPGAGQLQLDRLMLAFVLGGANPQDLLEMLNSISEDNIPAVKQIREALEAFRAVLKDLDDIRKTLEKLAKALKPGLPGASGGGLAGLLPGAVTGAAQAAAAAKNILEGIKELWEKSEKLVVDSAKLLEKLPPLAQAVGELQQTNLKGQTLPKGKNLQSQLQQLLEKYLRQQAENVLGPIKSVADVVKMADKITQAEKDLKKFLDDFKKVTDFIDRIAKGQIFRYADF